MVGVDATATRSCFLMLVQLMRSASATVVFACMSPALEALFRAHKVIGEKDVVIPLLDDALEWCEERVLIRCGNLECIVYSFTCNNTDNVFSCIAVLDKR